MQVQRTLPIRPLTRQEFERLVEIGAFQNERIELIDGFLVEMSPIGTRHAVTLTLLNELIGGLLRQRAWLRTQDPLAASLSSQPQPDLALVPREDYARAHPEQAFLVIEVADSSLEYDRREKATLYAKARVEEYWIVNLLDDVVEVHRDPDPRGSWRNVTTVGRGGSVSPRQFPDIALSVDAFISPR